MKIETTRTGALAGVHLKGADNGNRLTQDDVIQLGRVLGELAGADDLKVVVISSEGADFSLGRQAKPPTETPTPLQLRKSMMGPILEVYRALRRIEVPVVAVVQGEATGFGAALAGSCDITIAANTARFSFSEMKADMPPTLAMATVLDAVGPKALAWMVYTTDFVGAEEARQNGLVSKVVPAAELDTVREKVVGGLLERQRSALVGVKQYLAQARVQNFETAADYGANLLAVTLGSR